MKKRTTITIATLLGLGLASIGAGAAIAGTPPTLGAPASSSSVANTTEIPEAPGTGTETASDGPGGHADAPGVDVNHEGGANEK